jgi:hypothetical protein
MSLDRRSGSIDPPTPHKAVALRACDGAPHFKHDVRTHAGERRPSAMRGESIPDSAGPCDRHPYTNCGDADDGSSFVRRGSISMARSLSAFDAPSKWNRSTSRADAARRSNRRIAQRNATRSLTVLGASHSTPPLHFSPAHTLLRQVNRSASYPARASKRVPRTTPALAANPLPVAV